MQKHISILQVYGDYSLYQSLYSAGICDGAGMILLAEAACTAQNLTPLAKRVNYSAAGVLGLGPVPAMHRIFDNNLDDTGIVDVSPWLRFIFPEKVV